MPPRVFTIGHGTRQAEELVAILTEAQIETLIDVRRFPGSRRHPQFNQQALAEILGDFELALKAINLGPALKEAVPVGLEFSLQALDLGGAALLDLPTLLASAGEPLALLPRLVAHLSNVGCNSLTPLPRAAVIHALASGPRLPALRLATLPLHYAGV